LKFFKSLVVVLVVLLMTVVEAEVLVG